MGDWAQLMEAGKKHYIAGEFREASRYLREASQAAPESAETWRALGFALKENGNVPDAIGAFNTAIKIAPENPDGHFGLGLIQSENGDQASAVRSFDETLRLKPSHSAAHRALISSLLRSGQVQMLNSDHSGAERSFERAYALAPGSVETVVPYVERLVGSAQYKKALDVIEAACKLSPLDPKLKELHKETDEDPRLARAKREHSIHKA